MSRLTSAQVIELGHYLDPKFDPSTLTVSQLLGILGYHNVPYPSNHTKPKLIHAFEENITPNLAKLIKERMKRQNSAASDDGIVDGVTGEPLGQLPMPAPSVRRSTRRASRAPSEDMDPDSSPVKPEMVKRRRSSAQPRLGESSRKSTAISKAPIVVEESEPEEDEVPARKIGRKRKDGDDAGSRARRVSGPDSGWEDNNIFQSGAESSSPARPSPVKPRPARKSKSRKSTSAPPQIIPPTPPRVKRESEAVHPPSRAAFSPELPEEVVRESKLMSPNIRWSTKISPKTPSAVPLLAEDDDEVDERPLPRLNIGDLSPMDPLQEIEEELAEEAENAVIERTPEANFAVAVSERMRRGDKDVIRLPIPHSSSRPFVGLRRVTLTMFLLLFSAFSYNYQTISSTIGFCDPGSDTNSALEAYRSQLVAVEACNKENRTYVDVEESQLCPAPALLPLAQVISCTSCPEHATCTQFSVACNTGYIMKSHPLLWLLPPSSSPSNIVLDSKSTPADVLWKGVSYLDGLPGFGSVALPPRCVKDPKRQLRIGALGKAMQRHLAEIRGMKLCAGEDPSTSYPANEGGEARQWGMKEDDLRVAMRGKTAPHLLDTYDGLFKEAVQQVVKWSDVIVSEDSHGKRYYASKTPYLDFGCTVTVKTREVVHKSRSAVTVLLMLAAFFMYSRREISRRKNESKRVAELVQIALDSLRNQELAHHTDPVTAPAAYLSSLQLRDLILQDEHSIAARSRLWDKVERVVEGNANVRTNLEETTGGDEMRVWRWIGANGTPRGALRRQSLFQVSPGSPEQEDQQ